jgi:hypothetical protein
LCLIFSKSLSETFSILMKIERDIIKKVHRSSSDMPVILVRFSWKWSIFNRFLKILKFYENPSSGSRAVPNGQTDRHEANSRFSAILRKHLINAASWNLRNEKRRVITLKTLWYHKECYGGHCPFCEAIRPTKSTWNFGVNFLVFCKVDALFFLQLYRASWCYQSLLFTSWCTIKML